MEVNFNGKQYGDKNNGKKKIGAIVTLCNLVSGLQPGNPEQAVHAKPMGGECLMQSTTVTERKA